MIGEMRMPPPRTLLILALAGLTLACLPKPEPAAGDICDDCEDATGGHENYICVLDLQNQLTKQQAVVCVGPNSTPEVECNDICTNWFSTHGVVCLDYEARGTFACRDTLPAPGLGGSWQPSNYVEYNSTTNVYVVDQELIDALNVGASILNNDATYVEELATGGLEIKSVTTGTLAYELGLQSGDRPQTINGYSVTTMAGVFNALDAVRYVTSITAVVQRGSSTVTLSYSVR